jgi:hypothetical protein
VATSGVSEAVKHEAFQDFRAVSTQCQGLSVLGYNPIVLGIKGMGSGDDGCLVTIDRSDRAHLTLTLKVP